MERAEAAGAGCKRSEKRLNSVADSRRCLIISCITKNNYTTITFLNSRGGGLGGGGSGGSCRCGGTSSPGGSSTGSTRCGGPSGGRGTACGVCSTAGSNPSSRRGGFSLHCGTTCLHCVFSETSGNRFSSTSDATGSSTSSHFYIYAKDFLFFIFYFLVYSYFIDILNKI